MLAGFVFYSSNNQLCCGHPYGAHYLRIWNTGKCYFPWRSFIGDSGGNQESLGKTHFSQQNQLSEMRQELLKSCWGCDGVEGGGQTLEQQPCTFCFLPAFLTVSPTQIFHLFPNKVHDKKWELIFYRSGNTALQQDQFPCNLMWQIVSNLDILEDPALPWISSCN